jgi:hypothetical protein
MLLEGRRRARSPTLKPHARDACASRLRHHAQGLSSPGSRPDPMPETSCSDPAGAGGGAATTTLELRAWLADFRAAGTRGNSVSWSSMAIRRTGQVMGRARPTRWCRAAAHWRRLPGAARGPTVGGPRCFEAALAEAARRSLSFAFPLSASQLTRVGTRLGGGAASVGGVRGPVVPQPAARHAGQRASCMGLPEERLSRGASCR